MQFISRFSEVEATVARLEDFDPERVYVIFEGGKPTAVVEADAFEALFIPAVGPKRVQPERSAPKKKAVANTARDTTEKRVNASQIVLETIKKGPPRTSGELIQYLTEKKLITAPSQVYSACNFYKNSGEIEPRVSEQDGQRRWHMRSIE